LKRFRLRKSAHRQRLEELKVQLQKQGETRDSAAAGVSELAGKLEQIEASVKALHAEEQRLRARIAEIEEASRIAEQDPPESKSRG
jgi:predicted  nucleic acid-binding Zn-ribbon protein